jgi:hypothetical protein
MLFAIHALKCMWALGWIAALACAVTEWRLSVYLYVCTTYVSCKPCDNLWCESPASAGTDMRVTA